MSKKLKWLSQTSTSKIVTHFLLLSPALVRRASKPPCLKPKTCSAVAPTDILS